MTMELLLQDPDPLARQPHVFTSRMRAITLFDKALAYLGSLEPGTLVRCSFKGVSITDVSFVGQFVLKLRQYFTAIDNVIIAVSDCCEDVLFNVQAALSLRNYKICRFLPVGRLYLADPFTSYW